MVHQETHHQFQFIVPFTQSMKLYLQSFYLSKPKWFQILIYILKNSKGGWSTINLQSAGAASGVREGWPAWSLIQKRDHAQAEPKICTSCV